MLCFAKPTLFLVSEIVSLNQPCGPFTVGRSLSVQSRPGLTSSVVLIPSNVLLLIDVRNGETTHFTITYILDAIYAAFVAWAFLVALLSWSRSEEHTSELQSLMR